MKISTHLREASKRISIALLFASAAVMIAALTDGNATELFRLGLTGWLVGATGYLAGRSDVTAVMLAQEKESGYDEGFAAGCKATVRAGLADRPLTLLRPPKQLLEEDDLTSGTEGVV